MNYAALIRGIMPSNPNIRNANLCRVIEGLGYKNVQAIIASGNVIFSSDETDEQKIERGISAALKRELDIPGPAIVRSQQELEALLAAKPFGEQTHSKNTYLTVIFFADQTERKPILHPDIAVTRTTLREHCIVTQPDILPGPKAMQNIEKTYGRAITTRTWKTVERIVAKLHALQTP